MYPISNHLVNTAEAIPRLSGMVGEVFRRKYPNLELEIRLPNIMDRFRVKLPPNDHRLEIDNVSMGLGVLKHFGHFIQSLRIDATDMGSSELATINRFANIYCFETLMQFEIKSVMDDALNEFVVPFKEVEELNCRFKKNNLNETQPWNELFPKLRRLTLNMDNIFDVTSANFIDCTFPHMDYLYVRSGWEVWKKHPEQIRNLIRKNPTILSLEVYFFNRGLMEIISEYLPKLEALTLRSFSRY